MILGDRELAYMFGKSQLRMTCSMNEASPYYILSYLTSPEKALYALDKAFSAASASHNDYASFKAYIANFEYHTDSGTKGLDFLKTLGFKKVAEYVGNHGRKVEVLFLNKQTYIQEVQPVLREKVAKAKEEEAKKLEKKQEELKALPTGTGGSGVSGFVQVRINNSPY